MKKLFIYGLLFLSTYTVAQETDSINSKIIGERLATQLKVYPQEKIHLHLDRTYYVPGERIWFKAYLANASTHQPVNISRYVYVELLSPLDSLVSRVMIRPQENLYHGNILLPDEMAEGGYMIRAYTRYMENVENDYFFRKPIRIGSTLATQIQPEANFEFDMEKKKLLLDLYYTDRAGTTKIKPDRLLIHTSQGEKRNLRLDRDTIAHLSFDFQEIKQQKVLYVEADNYKHYISFPSLKEEYDVSFFPEGGYLLEGALCRVAFKALNANGTSEFIEGDIVDEAGEEIQKTRTLHNGMGLFTMTPEKGKRYFMRCTNSQGVEKQFEIPKPVSGAYSLATAWRRDKLYTSIIKTPDMPQNAEMYLLVHCRGEVCYFAPWNDTKQFLLFNKEDMPSGVIQLILFDGKMNPISERLVFNYNERGSLHTAYSTNQEIYKTREKVSVNLTVTDEYETDLAGHLSVAVTDDRDIAVDSCHTIVSTLLLSSELKGYIEDPGFYFKDQHHFTTNALDILMMVHGWRRYNLPDVVKGVYAYAVAPPEYYQKISGMVQRSLSSKGVEKGQVSLLALPASEEGSYMDFVETDEYGRFLFNAFELPDSTRVVVQALNDKGKGHVRLSVDPVYFPEITPVPLAVEIKGKAEAEDFDSYLAKAEERAKYDDNMRIIHLKEVEVVASRINKGEKRRESIFFSTSATALTLEDIERRNARNMSDLFQGVAGVQVRGGSSDFTLHIRGSEGSAAMFVDGIEMDAQTVSSMVPDDVARIEIYKGAEAAIFGLRGGNGVVNVITKTGYDLKPVEKEVYHVKKFNPLGFQRPVEFYSPKYETPQEKSDAMPDLRTTIYWKPDLMIEEEGKVSFEFYTSDISTTTYSVVIEGLSADGRIIHTVKTINIK